MHHAEPVAPLWRSARRRLQCAKSRHKPSLAAMREVSACVEIHFGERMSAWRGPGEKHLTTAATQTETFWRYAFCSGIPFGVRLSNMIIRPYIPLYLMPALCRQIQFLGRLKFFDISPNHVLRVANNKPDSNLHWRLIPLSQPPRDVVFRLDRRAVFA